SALIGQFYAYSPNFNGGVFVAAQQLSSNGRIATGAGAGDIGPRVKVIDPADLSMLDNNSEPTGAALLGDFFAFDPTFGGGVRVAITDVNGDGTSDIITGQGPGGQQVKTVDGTKLADLEPNQEIADSALLNNFAAFPGFNGGVFVGANAIPALSPQIAA